MKTEFEIKSDDESSHSKSAKVELNTCFEIDERLSSEAVGRRKPMTIEGVGGPSYSVRSISKHVLTAVLFIGAMIVGCRDPGPTDVEQVMATVSDLSDAARDAEWFHTLFVDGAAPAESERARYSSYVYNMDEPTVTGETAKVIVQITNAQGDDLGTQEWVFLFDAGNWKIQQAPLP